MENETDGELNMIGMVGLRDCQLTTAAVNLVIHS